MWVPLVKPHSTLLKKQVGQEPLQVSLTQCDAEEQGNLQVTGIVGADSEIFMSNTGESAGFMLTAEDGTTQIKKQRGCTGYG